MRGSAVRGWLRRRWVTAVACIALGIAIGAGATWPIVAAQNDSQVNAIEDKNAYLAKNKQWAIEARDRAIEERDDAIAEAEDVRDVAAKKRDKLQAWEDRLKKREKKVSKAEEIEAQSRFPGDGVYIVGQDMLAGTYRTAGKFNCYYAFMSDTSASAEIVDNQLTNGSAIVTLSDGQVFETSGCAEWVKSDS